MGGNIEHLIADAVRAAVRESMVDLQPAIAAAVMEASRAVGPTAAPYVSVKDAAAIMGAHPKTVRKLIAAGKLGRFTVEGRPRVKVADVHAYLAREGQPSPTTNLEERARRILASSD